MPFAAPSLGEAEVEDPKHSTTQEASANPTEASGPLEVVVVTADRMRAVSVQDIPIAVTALSPDSLIDKGKNGLQDIASVAPSISVQQNQRGVNRVDMRGVTTGTISITNVQDRPLVAIYLDDVPLALQSGNPDLRVFDLERIEVIRGPQGTLYGAGSMSGTIRYITVKPDTRASAGSVEASVSNVTHGDTGYSARGIFNLPITETVAARFGAYQGRDPGYLNNIRLGDNNANFSDTTQARGAVRFKPNDAFTLDTSLTFAKLHSHGQDVGYFGRSRYEYTSLGKDSFEDNFKIYNVTGAYDGGFATLSASTSYLDRTTHLGQDTSDSLLFLGLEPVPSPLKLRNRLKDFSEEIRLVSAQSDLFNWTVGLFYQHTKRDYLQGITAEDFDINWGALIGDPDYNSVIDSSAFNPNEYFSTYTNIREHQFAQFGEAKLTLGKFDLTAGVRHFNHKQNFNYLSAGAVGDDPAAPGTPLTIQGGQSSDGFNPRFVADFNATSDIMFYAEAAKGFRYGGVNQPLPLQGSCADELAELGLTQGPAIFGPDQLWSYTLGEKGQFFDRRLIFNLAAFHIDWNDVQTNKNLACGFYFTENEGKVRSRGVELETRLRVTDALTISGNASYTSAKANGPIPNASAVDGDRVPFFPRYIAYANADYVIPVRAGSLTLSTDVSYRSQTFTEFNPSYLLYRRIPSSTVIGAAVNYENDRYEVGLFGTNLNNSRRISNVQFSYYQAFLGLDIPDIVSYGVPRTFGIRGRVKF